MLDNVGNDMTNLDEQAEALAEAILRAAGSGLRHYTPFSRAEILNVARAQIAQLTARGDRR